MARAAAAGTRLHRQHRRMPGAGLEPLRREAMVSATLGLGHALLHFTMLARCTRALNCWAQETRRTLPARSDARQVIRWPPSDTTACAIRSSVLELYCWGSDTYRWGSLGDGAAVSQYLCKFPAAGSGTRYLPPLAASHPQWGCGIQTNGSLSCWGYNRWGSLGDNSTLNRPTPVLVARPRARFWASLPPRGHGLYELMPPLPRAAGSRSVTALLI